MLNNRFTSTKSYKGEIGTSMWKLRTELEEKDRYASPNSVLYGRWREMQLRPSE